MGRASLLDVADLKGGRNPIREGKGFLDRCEGGISLGLVFHDTTVKHGGAEEAAFHRGAGGKDGVIAEEGLDHVLNVHLLELAAVRRRERRKGAHEEVKGRLRNEVREKLAKADFDGEEAAEAHGGGQAAEHLCDEEVEIIHGRVLNAPLAMSQLEQGFIVENEARIGEAAHRVEREDGVVRLCHHAGDLRGR